MARTNQGVFKKLQNEYKVLENEYEQVMKEYFSDGDWNGTGDFFSDFAYSADRVYRDATNLAYEIKGMMNATKFEEEDNTKKYKQMLSDSQEKARDIKREFERILKLFKMSGGISDMEQRTLDNLMIYR